MTLKTVDCVIGALHTRTISLGTHPDLPLGAG